MLGTNRGFSLIEMMAALFFLAMSLVGLASLPVSAVKAASYARNVAAATNLALDKIEDLRGADWATLASGSDTTLEESDVTPDDSSDGDSSFRYGRSWTVATGPVVTTKEVAVTVTWQDIGQQRVTLRTVISE